jgi:FkbM family methyltransferase
MNLPGSGKNRRNRKSMAIIYKGIMKIFRMLPAFARNSLVRFSRLPNDKFYNDLRYKGRFRVKTLNKSFYMFTNGGTVENEIFWKGLRGKFEPATIRLWQLLCKECPCIIDVGANTGIYSLIAKAVNRDSRIFSFEPSKKTFAELQKNIDHNQYDIRAFELALSDNADDRLFYDIEGDNQTSASFSPKMAKESPGFKGKINEYKVKTTTLDDFVTEHSLAGVDLVKIDVELHEPEVLKGMTETMKKHRPLIIFEVLIDEVADQLNVFFKDKNHYLFHILEDKDKIDLKLVDIIVGTIYFDWNYLACPKEKIGILKKCGLVDINFN